MMRKYIFLLMCLISNLCFAQHHVCVYSTKVQFDEEAKVYQIEKQSLKTATIYIYDTLSKMLYTCEIIDGFFIMPNAIVDKNCWISLLYNGRYYYTDVLWIDSILSHTPYWIFRIEDGKYSKDFYGNCYFALSIPPLEYGPVAFRNKWKYFRTGRLLVRNAKKQSVTESGRTEFSVQGKK